MTNPVKQQAFKAVRNGGSVLALRGAYDLVGFEDEGRLLGRPPSISHALLMSGSPCGIAPPPCGPRSIVACLGVTAVAARSLVSQDGKRSSFLCLRLSSRPVGCGSVSAISRLLSSCALCSCAVWHQIATKPGVPWSGAGRTNLLCLEDGRRWSGWGVMVSSGIRQVRIARQRRWTGRLCAGCGGLTGGRQI
jgi:hypothetical protein